MHYPNHHRFALPSVPTQRIDSEGRPMNEWYIPIPGIAGHYLYSNGDISHSFNIDLTNDGYDWIYPTLQSALDATSLYFAKTENETFDPPILNHNQPTEPDIILDAYYDDHNQAVSDAIPTRAIPNPILEVTAYVEFLEPRPHTAISHKWVVANFIPGVQEAERHIYLHDNSKTITREVISGFYESTALFNSKDEAQEALDAYRAKYNIPYGEIVSLPDNIVHKLLEPQIIPNTFSYWEVLSAEDPNFALSDSNSIVHVAYRAQFDTFQSALFAKLRYERTHRDLVS